MLFVILGVVVGRVTLGVLVSNNTIVTADVATETNEITVTPAVGTAVAEVAGTASGAEVPATTTEVGTARAAVEAVATGAAASTIGADLTNMDQPHLRNVFDLTNVLAATQPDNAAVSPMDLGVLATDNTSGELNALVDVPLLDAALQTHAGLVEDSDPDHDLEEGEIFDEDDDEVDAGLEEALGSGCCFLFFREVLLVF